MISWMNKRKYGPIGIDFGSRSMKLIQFTADGQRIVDVARFEITAEAQAGSDPKERTARLVEILSEARKTRNFKGRDVAVCLSEREMFVQNLRVPKADGADLVRLVQQEAAGKIPFPIAESQLDFYEAADIRQGDATLREVIVMACHRPVLDQMLAAVDGAGLRPIAVDVEPAALLRNYVRQLRREEDRSLRSLYVHMGYSKTAVFIAQGEDMLFLKYVDQGGKAIDEAVARRLEMSQSDATSVRRNHGDRRTDQQDPDIAQAVMEASRPVVERLAGEIAMCMRYHSVTFRGHPLVRLVLGGGEATPQLLELLTRRLDLKAELSDPFRVFSAAPQLARRSQWDVAAGLAYRTAL